MSEYQYYEFRAVDRPLGKKEMGGLRALSTRAEITPTSFTNTYHWGDFKGDPGTLMDRYFDAFVYVANWGTHRLMLRFPRGLLDAEAASGYCDDEALTLKVRKEHVVLEFSSDDEDGDEWTEGEQWMSSLISIRAELMRGDLRALYLGWLASLRSRGWDAEDGPDSGDPDDERLEPPVPPGLAKLSASQRALAEFLRVEDELIEVAATGGAGEAPAEPARPEMARWLKGLPAADKDAYLLRFLAEEGDIPLRAELAMRFRDATRPTGKVAAPDTGRRTAGQLLAARDALVAAKERKAAGRAARERARLDREKAEARSRYLDDLSRRQPASWSEVESLIATKRPKDYDRAVDLLVDLRELAGRSGSIEEADVRIRGLRQRHSGKPSLMKRLDGKNLGK